MTATEEEKNLLSMLREQDPAAFDTDDSTYELFENLVANSQFDWIDPSVTGDLTSAPMLAVLGHEETADKAPELGDGYMAAGFDGKKHLVQPVLLRFAFMDYQVTSPQRSLAETGKAFWAGGVALVRRGRELAREGEAPLPLSADAFSLEDK